MKSLELRFVSALIRHRELWWRLTERAVASRYKASALGFGWSILQPLIMMGVYTFVFSTIFESRWRGYEEAGALGFAINLFAGLIVFNLFADCVGSAAGLIVNNKNYVTKVIFPLELLVATSVSSATFQAMTSTTILLVFQIIALHKIPTTLIWLPFIWIPLVLGCLALGWFLSSIGVFIRDVEQIVPMILSIMMFMSGVFYPVSSLPAVVRPIMYVNPLSVVIEQTRRVMLDGLAPSRWYLMLGLCIGLLVCETAYRGFQRARRDFADVL